MTEQNRIPREEILKNQEKLERTRGILKEEFIGIDEVIDDVIDSLSSWYLFPDIQEKPIIINLWGMTGVGKSALVERISELLDHQDRTFSFDLGEKDGDNVRHQLEDAYQEGIEEPGIIVLDEFQHARTIKEDGTEKNSECNFVWQLLDEGKFEISNTRSFLKNNLFELLLYLRSLVQKGVHVSKGRVIHNEQLYLEKMDLGKKESRDRNGDLLFVPKDFYEDIHEIDPKSYESPLDVEEKLCGLNGNQTLEFLWRIYIKGLGTKTIECSRSVIFVIGNVDEAYKMAHTMDPDIEADEFHRLSKKITVPTIKKALKRRFRSEQIARLGNNHIIYPAFDNQTYQTIIERELHSVSERFREVTDIHLEYDESVHDIAYKEGVYPTQGTRPVFSTIHNLINTKLGRVASEPILKGFTAKKARFIATEERLLVEFYEKGEIVHWMEFDQKLELSDLRKNKKDDDQAVVAVHEAGHAVLIATLLKIIPESILSTTVDDQTGGFVYTRTSQTYLARNEILPKLASILGGNVAERIVFGDERVTTHSEDDLHKATELIMDSLKVGGMSDVPGVYYPESLATNSYLHDKDEKLTEDGEEWLREAEELAEKNLTEQKDLLLKVSDHLADNRSLSKEGFKALLWEYGRGMDVSEFSDENKRIDYRRLLKEQVHPRVEKKNEFRLNGASGK